MAMRDAIVVGAGVVGLTTAYYLAREGMSVAVVDARPEPALETSFANGGLITPSTAAPWSSPAVPRQLLSWLGRESAPLLLRFSAIPSIGLWGLRFLANCRPAKHRVASLELSRFAHTSLEETEALLEAQAVDFALKRGGLLEIFRGRRAAATRDAHTAFLQGLGVRTIPLDAQQCVALEPELAPIAPSIGAGLHLPDDVWGDARRFTLAVAQAARAQGAELHLATGVRSIAAAGGRVAGVETDAGRLQARRVVVCAGVQTRALLLPLRIGAPIVPVKGYSLSIPCAGLAIAPARPILDDAAHVAITPLGDQLRVAGTAEFGGYDTTLRPGRLRNLVDALRSVFPGIALPTQVSHWCGLRPMTADGLPIIDRTPIAGLFVNAGHGALGWTLACGSARLVADLVVGRQRSRPAFALDRSYW